MKQLNTKCYHTLSKSRLTSGRKMNRVAKALLNVMRIEVLLGIGLVLWVFSIEVKAQTWVCNIEGEQWIYNKNSTNEWTEILSKADWIDQPIISKLKVVDEGFWWIRLATEEKPSSVSYTTLNKLHEAVVVVHFFDGKTSPLADKTLPIVTQGECKVED